jgi:hypothetical protein
MMNPHINRLFAAYHAAKRSSQRAINAADQEITDAEELARSTAEAYRANPTLERKSKADTALNDLAAIYGRYIAWTEARQTDRAA